LRSSRNDLLKAYGEQNWWPVDEDYHREQGTDPRESFESILEATLERLEELIKPSGYYKQKAARLKTVAKELSPVSKVKRISREELLGIKGIGGKQALLRHRCLHQEDS